MMVSFVLSFFPRDVLDEILNLIESVSEDFPSYSCIGNFASLPQLCPIHSRLVYDPTGTIFAILYSEVPYMFPAKYQPNRHNGSGKEVI